MRRHLTSLFLAAGTVALAWCAPAGEATAPDVRLYQQALTRHVNDSGRVDYAGLKADFTPLDTFVKQMAAVSPESHPALFPSREAKLAYWINAYNALMMHDFARNWPQGKDRLKGKLAPLFFFKRLKYPVGGREKSLDEIEHAILRPQFKEPRIHFAIVCASASCPWLSNEAYTPDRMNAQLERAAQRFISQDRNVALEGENTVRLSKIFDWFEKDFAPDKAGVLRYVAKHREKDAKRLTAPGVKVDYFDYDWTVNDVNSQYRK